MESSTISSKYQVVIPRKIREQFHLAPGQKVVFIPYQNSMRLVIVPSVENAFGSIKGLDTHFERDEEEHL